MLTQAEEKEWPADWPMRGIIVIDSTTLPVLSQKLSDSILTIDGQKEPSGVCLGDAVIYLARHGYKVVIPEGVAYAGAAYTCGGALPIDRFLELNGPQYRQNLSFIKRLQQVTDAITPYPENDESAEAVYVRQLSHNIKLGGGLVRPNFSGSVGAIVAGAPSAWMKGLKEPISTPIFYFSQSPALRAQFHAANPNIMVHNVNTAGFFNALKETEILPKVGMKRSIPTAKVIQDIMGQLYDTEVRIPEFLPVDSELPFAPAHGHHIFRNSLRNLDQIIPNAASDHETLEDTEGQSQPAATSRHQKLFGKDGPWAALAKKGTPNALAGGDIQLS